MKIGTRLLACVTLLAFIILALNFDTPRFEAFDVKMKSLLYGNDFIISFHYLGETQFVVFAALMIALYLWVRNKDIRGMIFVLLAIGGGYGLNQLLKRIFARPRPEIADQLTSYSFPSGHAQISILFFLMLAFLISGKLNSQLWKTVAYCAAIALFILIGLSRIAEGRHFPTDVLAGWSIGYTWFIICVLWYKSKSGDRRIGVPH